MEAHLANIKKKNLGKENVTKDQARWEYLKNQIRKVFNKNVAKKHKNLILIPEKNTKIIRMHCKLFE